jgi:hypothetical protein
MWMRVCCTHEAWTSDGLLTPVCTATGWAVSQFLSAPALVTSLLRPHARHAAASAVVAASAVAGTAAGFAIFAAPAEPVVVCIADFDPDDGLVCTVGKLSVWPGASNVIAGSANFTVRSVLWRMALCSVWTSDFSPVVRTSLEHLRAAAVGLW